ncbi:hypothetical protein RRF57_012279 [Xylaria bambusicola]|uniref:Uncharacterized protein n=1 Tax=Xylaria bambusicola TaxID=326684 RepID=A0AAN7UUY0_9PEZI
MTSKVNRLVSFYEDKAKTGDVATSPNVPIAAYGLRREGGAQASLADTAFIEPYTGHSENAWYSNYKVSLGPLNALCWYVVSPLLRSYVTMSIRLTKDEEIGSERYTKMRYRDMMVDNYLDAGGDLRTWQWMGIANIANIVTRKLMREVLEGRGIDHKEPPCSAEVLRGDKEFAHVLDGNPFTRGIQGLLRKYEKDMGKAKIKRVIFVISPFDYHMIVEMYRPGENGYPDET